MCKTVVPNDDVPVESAIWKIKDNALSKNVRTELIFFVLFIPTLILDAHFSDLTYEEKYVNL